MGCGLSTNNYDIFYKFNGLPSKLNGIDYINLFNVLDLRIEERKIILNNFEYLYMLNIKYQLSKNRITYTIRYYKTEQDAINEKNEIMKRKKFLETISSNKYKN